MTRQATGPAAAALLGPFAFGALVLGTLVSAAGVSGQETRTPRVTDVTLSPDTVGIGDRFQVELTMVLPDGTVAFAPDSIVAAGFEPVAPVEWSATQVAAGGVELTVTYPLIAFDVGPVEVPEFEVFTASASEAGSAGLTEPDATLGSWTALQTGGSVPSIRMHVVPARELWVTSAFGVDDVAQGIQPRPPADVVGGNRDWPATLLMLGFGVVLLSVVTLSTQEWRQRNDRVSNELADPRAAALLALDQLLAEGAHRSGRMRDFYARSSEIVRRFVEGLSHAWGPSYTSSELMASLSRLSDGNEDLVVEMLEAEVVKFSTTRPDESTAERHWRVLRTWVEEREPPATTPAGADAA